MSPRERAELDEFLNAHFREEADRAYQRMKDDMEARLRDWRERTCRPGAGFIYLRLDWRLVPFNGSHISVWQYVAVPPPEPIVTSACPWTFRSEDRQCSPVTFEVCVQTGDLSGSM